jgi:hypothetical protein
MIDWLWDHFLIVAFIAFAIGFIGAIVILEKSHARSYQTLPGHGSWGIRRRPSGHIEINIGQWVITTEPE